MNFQENVNYQLKMQEHPGPLIIIGGERLQELGVAPQAAASGLDTGLIGWDFAEDIKPFNKIGPRGLRYLKFGVMSIRYSFLNVQWFHKSSHIPKTRSI